MKTRLQIEEIINYNDCHSTLRMYVYTKDDDDKWYVTDIIEGPDRFIMNYAIKHFSPKTNLRMRKVK